MGREVLPIYYQVALKTLFISFSDVNECLEGLAQCHQYAGCHNEKGSYQCVCTGHYFGDGKRCKGKFS